MPGGSRLLLINERRRYVFATRSWVIELIVLQGICLGSGIGNFDEIYDTVVSYDKGVSVHLGFCSTPINGDQGYRKISPLFVPKLLINLGAGHVSMKYGFMVGHGYRTTD